MTTHCNRCNAKVVFENVSPNYYAVCPEHDEDLYEFETYDMADKELSNWFDEFHKQEDKVVWLEKQAKLAVAIDEEDLDRCRLMCVCDKEKED
jgi:hypothetical protein